MSFHISFGWWLLIGGLWGALANLRAKTVNFTNLDGNVSEKEMREADQPVTPKLRMVIVSSCFALAILGAWKIQHDHWWNPFLGHPTDRKLSPLELQSDK
jgi:hypothetical protein